MPRRQCLVDLAAALAVICWPSGFGRFASSAGEKQTCPLKAGYRRLQWTCMLKSSTRGRRSSAACIFVLFALRNTFLPRPGQVGCDAWILARIYRERFYLRVRRASSPKRRCRHDFFRGFKTSKEFRPTTTVEVCSSATSERWSPATVIDSLIGAESSHPYPCCQIIDPVLFDNLLGAVGVA